MSAKLKIALTGLTADRGWSGTAHIPALRALSEDVALIGVANSRRPSAEVAVQAFGMGRAFDNVESLVASPDIDAIVVTVKVRHHYDLIAQAIEAGKHVYCEWPLAMSLAEAQDLAAMAKRKQVVAVIGTQAVVSPEIVFLRDLLKSGYLGDLRSSTFLGSGNTWGDDVSSGEAYAMDPANGATLLSVMAGHAFSALEYVLDPIASVGGHLAQRQLTARIEETGETIPVLTPDQMVAAGAFSSGLPFAFQLRGGLPCGTRLLWEICGSDYDLRVTPQPGEAPVINISALRIESCQRGMTNYQDMVVPSSYYRGLTDVPAMARNVLHLYRLFIDDIRMKTRIAPSFDDAVNLHRLIDRFETGSTPR